MGFWATLLGCKLPEVRAYLDMTHAEKPSQRFYFMAAGVKNMPRNKRSFQGRQEVVGAINFRREWPHVGMKGSRGFWHIRSLPGGFF